MNFGSMKLMENYLIWWFVLNGESENQFSGVKNQKVIVRDLNKK